MKSLGQVPTVAWVLLGLMLISMGVLAIGKREREAFPSATSYAPSGASAFAELLRQNGYAVRITRSPNPVIAADEVPVVFYLTPNTYLLSPDAFDDQHGVHLALRRHLERGGRALVVTLNTRFHETSLRVMDNPVDLKSQVGRSYRVHVRPAAEATDYTDAPYEHASEIIEYVQSYVSIGKFSEGTLISVGDGTFMTNRFIDAEDNARLALHLVRLTAPEGAQLVLPEATFGNEAETTVLHELGGWAVAAWWQIVILMLVIVISLGQRFGIADEQARRRQRGTRELVDAVIYTYKRAGATHAAMLTLYHHTDHMLRRSLKLPRDAPDHVRNDMLPPTLTRALVQVQAASTEPMPESVAVQAARRLEKEVEEFLGKRAQPMNRRSARKAH